MINNPADFEVPSSVRDMASKSLDQAKDAYNRFMDAARQAQDMIAKSTNVMTVGAKEVQDKAFQYTEANVQANFELANRLVKAKDLKEALEIQAQFARNQMESYAQQAQELSRLVAAAAQKAQPSGGDRY